MKKPVGQEAHATETPPATAAGDDPFGLAPWLKEMPDVRLHPLMAHPVAAMVATSAIGLGIAGQMAGAMLGVMQSAAERTKSMLDEAAELAGRVENAEGTAAPVKAKPELRVVPEAETPVVELKAKVAREKSATPRAAKAVKADDLKAISGIGPKLEQVLNGMGLKRYADIAALTDADAERIEAELGFSGRIARDGWVEQAKALGKGRG